MKNRSLLLIGAVEAIMLLLGVYFEPTCCVRGRLHGEALFDGKPTSWWRQELGRWQTNGMVIEYAETAGEESTVSWTTPGFSRTATWCEKIQERLRPRQEPVFLDQLFFDSPKLLQGDEAGVPVLRELLDDPAPEIRNLARIGLGLHPDYPRKNDKDWRSKANRITVHQLNIERGDAP
jgi:hypothetical protein